MYESKDKEVSHPDLKGQINGQITREGIISPNNSRDLFISKEDIPTYSVEIGDTK